MKPLWPAWPRLRERFVLSPKKLLLLDFDGTLAPIARVPRAVVLPPAVRRSLRRLAARRDYRLCLVSGRSVLDLRRFIRGPRWIYVGNHGFEMRGRGISTPATARLARQAAPLIRELAENLRRDLAHVAGVLIENKGITLSLHFRNVPRGLMPLVRGAVRSARRRASRLPLVWRRGKKVWEARPMIDWNKGRAALYLKRRFRGSAVAAIGDDETDEDMFRMLKGKGLTIHVGRTKTAADYYVGSQKEVAKFLEELCR